jgi:hypothetical protein
VFSIVPDTLDFTRFRRKKLKRWQINLINSKPGDKEKFVPAHFTEEEWENSFRPRKRIRRRRKRKSKSRKGRFKISASVRFRERRSGGQVGSLYLGNLTAFHNGVQVPPQTGAPLNTSITAVTQISGVVERTWDNINPGPPYRSGGNFTKIRVSLPHNVVQGHGRYITAPANRSPASKFLQYDGGFSNPKFLGDPTTLSTYLGSGISPWNNSLLPAFQDLGPQAYALLRPTPERASVGQFLVELREFPQMISNLRKSARDFHALWKGVGGDLTKPSMYPKRAAEEYLGYQFGWLPFLRDIESVWNLTRNLHEFMAEVTRLNNTWIRRRRTVSEGEETTLVSRSVDWQVEPIGSQYVAMTAPMSIASLGTCNWYTELHTVVKHTAWAEGSFKFWRPEFDASLAEFNSVFMQVQRYMTLYGARVTPTLLWKVTPWTWLVDWVTNAGKNVDNISSMLVDSVVSKYFYLMHHQTRQLRMTQVINFWDKGAVTMSWAREYESKQRASQTTPFGFDLSRSSLSGSQWSILGALGLSKLT